MAECSGLDERPQIIPMSTQTPTSHPPAEVEDSWESMKQYLRDDVAPNCKPGKERLGHIIVNRLISHGILEERGILPAQYAEALRNAVAQGDDENVHLLILAGAEVDSEDNGDVPHSAEL